MNKEELKSIYAGEMNLAAVGSIIAGIMFVIGLINGFVNPEKCNNA